MEYSTMAELIRHERAQNERYYHLAWLDRRDDLRLETDDPIKKQILLTVVPAAILTLLFVFL